MKPYEKILYKKESYIKMLQPMRIYSTVASHGWVDCHPFFYDESRQRIYRVEQKFITWIEEAEVESGNKAILRIHSKPFYYIEKATQLWITTLNLDWDLKEFYEICENNHLMRQASKIGAGRIMRGASLFEDVCKAISFTNTRWIQAAKNINKFVETANLKSNTKCTKQNNKCIYPYPSQQQLIDIGETGFKQASLGYRALYIYKFVKGADIQKLEQIVKTDSKEFLAYLLKIPGIGPTTAHYLMTMYGRFDTVSADSAVIAHFKKVHPEIVPKPEAIKDFYKKNFGKFASLAWFVEHLLAKD